MGGFFWIVLLIFTSVMMYLLWKLLEYQISPEELEEELNETESIAALKRVESTPISYHSPIPFFSFGGDYPYQIQAPLSGHPDVPKKMSNYSLYKPSNYSLKRMSNYSFVRFKNADDNPFGSRIMTDYPSMNRSYPVTSKTTMDLDYTHRGRNEAVYSFNSRGVANDPTISRSMADYPMTPRSVANYPVGNRSVADYRSVTDYSIYNRSVADYPVNNTNVADYPVNNRSNADYSFDSRIAAAYPSSSRSTAYQVGSRNPAGYPASSRGSAINSQIRSQIPPTRSVVKSVSSPSVKIN